MDGDTFRIGRPMHPDVIPRKTERARTLLLQRDALPRSRRLFLIMIDGQKSLRDLSDAARQLGIDSAMIASMVNAGLVQWQRDEPAPLPAKRVVATATAGQTPAPSFSLAAAKFYAMNLTALMLPGEDAELREAARQVTDADGLRNWLGTAAMQIAARAGDDRGNLFLGKVAGMLPADFFEILSL